MTGVHAVAFALGLALSAPASPVDLAFDACVDVDRDETARLVRIELVSLGGRARALPPDARIAVTATCTGELVVLRVADPLTDKTLERGIRLERTTTAARPRLLALAIVGLLVASWAELDAPVRAAPPPVPPRPVAVAAPPGRDERRLTVACFGGGTWNDRGVGLAAALGVRGAIDLVAPLAAIADLRFETGDAATALGAVELQSVSLALGAGPRVRSGHVAARLGLALRGGWARLTGRPNDPGAVLGERVTGAWLAGGVIGTLGWVATSGALIEVAAEAAYVTLPVAGRVAGSPQVGVGDLAFAASLGLGWAF